MVIYSLSLRSFVQSGFVIGIFVCATIVKAVDISIFVIRLIVIIMVAARARVAVAVHTRMHP